MISSKYELQQQKQWHEAISSFSEADTSNIQSVAASQIKMLTSFYQLVLHQAGRSFFWALVAAVVGLGFFLLALGFLILRQSQDIAIASTISGTIIEIIAGLNFYLYGKTTTQLATFHSRLEATQSFLLANSMCEALGAEARDISRAVVIKEIVRSARESELQAPEQNGGKGDGIE